MSLLVLAKEWIIINEELAVYISFFIVLYILISNLGATMTNQFAEKTASITSNYSLGATEEEKNSLTKTIVKLKVVNYISDLLNVEKIRLKKILKIADLYISNLFSIKFKLD